MRHKSKLFFLVCKHATEWRQQLINVQSVFALQWCSWASPSFGKRVVAPQGESSSITNVFLWATRSTDSSFCFWGNVCEGTQGRYAGSSTPNPTCLSHVNHLSVITQQFKSHCTSRHLEDKGSHPYVRLKMTGKCRKLSYLRQLRAILWVSLWFPFWEPGLQKHCQHAAYLLQNQTDFAKYISSIIWDWNAWTLFGFTGLVFFAWGCSNTVVSSDTQLLVRTVPPR